MAATSGDMSAHDALYHRMFSHREMVAQLLREFVTEPWAAELDLDAMERVNGKLLGRKGIRRETDVIWRIPWRAGGDAYVLLMLEFQSTADPWMALRVLVYAGMLWQDVVKQKRLLPNGKLPPVFPLVLYNGARRWRAALSLHGLIGLPPGSRLWMWQPRMRYHLLAERDYGDNDLARRDTLAALLFRLENAEQHEQIIAATRALVAWFRGHPGFAALREVFAELLMRVIETGDGGDQVMNPVRSLLEIETMLENRPAEWKRQWTAEGRRDGAADVLEALLEQRFGEIPEAAKQRIAAATPAQIRKWSLRLAKAATIDKVLH